MNIQNSLPIFIKIGCPSCGGKIGKRDSNDQYTCSFCGNQFLVSGHDVRRVDVIDTAQNGIGNLTSELAIKRIKSELEILISQREQYLDEWNTLNSIHNRPLNSKRIIKFSLWLLMGCFIIFIIAVTADIMILGLTSTAIFLMALFVIIGEGMKSAKKMSTKRQFQNM
jgi:predicted RNA-binding Zn-ribbon protein involved in translation (DUF1610 family)